MPFSNVRSKPSTSRLRDVFRPYQQELGRVPLTAWDAYDELYGHVHHLHDKTEVANLISSLMRRVARDACDERDGLDYRQEYGNTHKFNVVIVERELMVRFKKLDENLQPSNVSTELQKKLDRGLTTLFGDQIRGLVTVGYVPNELRTRVEGVHAVRHGGGGNSTWEIEVGKDRVVDYRMDDLFGVHSSESEPGQDRKPEKGRDPEPVTLKPKSNAIQAEE